MDIEEAAATGEVDLANALDLSDSEEEEELEDLIEDFALQADLEQVCISINSVCHSLITLPRTRVFDKKNFTSSSSQTHFLLSSRKHHYGAKCQ